MHSHTIVTEASGGAAGWSGVNSVRAANTGYSTPLLSSSFGAGDSGNLQPYRVSNYVIKV